MKRLLTVLAACALLMLAIGTGTAFALGNQPPRPPGQDHGNTANAGNGGDADGGNGGSANSGNAVLLSGNALAIGGHDSNKGSDCNPCGGGPVRWLEHVGNRWLRDQWRCQRQRWLRDRERR